MGMGKYKKKRNERVTIEWIKGKWKKRRIWEQEGLTGKEKDNQQTFSQSRVKQVNILLAQGAKLTRTILVYQGDKLCSEVIIWNVDTDQHWFFFLYTVFQGEETHTSAFFFMDSRRVKTLPTHTLQNSRVNHLTLLLLIREQNNINFHINFRVKKLSFLLISTARVMTWQDYYHSRTLVSKLSSRVIKQNILIRVNRTTFSPLIRHFWVKRRAKTFTLTHVTLKLSMGKTFIGWDKTIRQTPLGWRDTRTMSPLRRHYKVNTRTKTFTTTQVTLKLSMDKTFIGWDKSIGQTPLGWGDTHSLRPLHKGARNILQIQGEEGG